MAGTQGQQPQSQFNQRSDNAALALKGIVSKEQGINIPERKVEVGPDGQPPKPPPPEGSYARNAHDRARAEQHMQQMQQQGDPVIGQQPPAGTLEQALDGSQAPPLPQTAQPSQGPDSQELSPNAQQRFAKLTQDLREMDQERQTLLEKQKADEQSNAEMRASLEALQQQHQQMVQANLDNLDPETRMQVMNDARMQEQLANFENRILSKINPELAQLKENRAHDELMKLAGKYPNFDVQVHGPLIEMYRGKNKHSSVEQSYKAIAEGDELVIRGSVTATAVPPTVAPRASVQSPASRYVPEPVSDPEQEMHEEAAQIGKLMRSMDAADHKTGQRLVEKNLIDRLGATLPGAHRR